jgi:hypothetical protein
MKKVLIGLAVLALGVAVAVVWLLRSLDEIVENQIETIGSELAGVPVRVGSVGIDIKSGTGVISDLRIANPDGYAAPDAFEMSTLRADIDLQSVGKQPLVLDELMIDSAVVHLETSERSRSNLTEILDNVSRNTRQADAKAETADSGEPMRIAIRRLLIKGVTFTESNPLEEGEPRKGTLPAIERTQVGGSNGATPGEIGKIVIRELGGKVVRQAAKEALKEVIEERAGDLLQGIGERLRKE